MNDEDLRDCFAMFITAGLVMRESLDINPYAVWDTADSILKARKKKEVVEVEDGIVAIKPKRRSKSE